ncbi:MAG: hypothetical protein NW206_19140 [Hyphomonadaceae bacterium]|nr:hypothetical protein [Hyphomonadaceae bacterium]
MKKLSASLLFLTLAACGQPAPPAADTSADVAESVAVPACVADAPARTIAFAGQSYQIQAHAEGATCDEAIATLKIIAPNGATAFETAYPIAQVPLAFNATGSGVARLTTELESWTQNVAEQPTADSLPAWPDGADKPPNFTPALSREAYEAARTARQPIFCFPDGAESNACVAINTSAQAASLLGSRTPERT